MFKPLVAALTLWCTRQICAQQGPKVEVFGGLSYANYEVLGANQAQNNQTLRLGALGWNGSVTANFNRWFGLTTEIGGDYSTSTATVATTSGTICKGSQCEPWDLISDTYSSLHHLSFRFGPQYSFQAGKVRPFAHLLMGWAQQSDSQSETDFSNLTGQTTVSAWTNPSNIVFSPAIGGGVDYPIRKRLSWRAGVDYLISSSNGNNLNNSENVATGTPALQNHVRVLTGLVWRPGR